MKESFPPWLKKTWPASGEVVKTLEVLQKANLPTVCVSARCPNLGECFARRTATFLILGDVCTRNCRFCAVNKGKPAQVNKQEPEKVAKTALQLGLKHIVITSVTRDDLPDEGAGHFVATIQAVQQIIPYAVIEVLTPDFRGDVRAIQQVVEAGPDIFNHNVETVPRLYPVARPQADYLRSLMVLQRVKEIQPRLYIKSGLMLGLGEEGKEVEEVLRDLRKIGCDFVTLGQYLQPTPWHLPVEEFVSPEIFAVYEEKAKRMGFLYVASGSFVRSSYQAENFLSLKNEVGS